MGVRYYDDALYEKIQAWVKDKRMKILKPNEVARTFQLASEAENDKPIKLPLITLSRDTNIFINNPNKKPMTFDGALLSSDGKKSQQLNAIPITLSYQLDIYTKEFEVGDEYVRNFIFNLMNHPKLQIVIPYNNLNFLHNANIRLDATVQDNSDVPQRLFSGQFTRWTISFTIDDAYLFSAPVEDNVYICGDSDVELVD